MKNLLITAFLFAALAINAQTTTDTIIPFKRFKLNDFSLTYGSFGGYVRPNSQNDIENLLGHSSAVIQDPTAYFNNYYYEGNHTTLSANFKINTKKIRLYQTLGIGITFSNAYAFDYNKYTYYRAVIDTLTSNSSPYFVLVDTIARYSQHGGVNTSNILLNLSYRIGTNPRRKFSVYATANLGIGGAVKSTYRNYDEYYYGKEVSGLIDTTGTLVTNTNIYGYSSYGYQYQQPSNNSEAAAKPFILKPYITTGLNYRFSKHIHVLRNLSLNLEARYGSQILFVKGRAYSGFSAGAAIGLRYTLRAL